MALPTPIGRQKEVLYLPAQGHCVVLGTAGSGKTTLAIMRSAYLSDSNTDHGGRTLLVTFNKTLVTYLKHFQDSSLKNVCVENYHVFARGYLQSRGKMSRDAICGNDQKHFFVTKASRILKSNNDDQPFFNKPIDFYLEEIHWLGQNGITDLDLYNETERVGRGTPIDRKSRKHMFELYQEYLRLRTEAGYSYDWDDLPKTVTDEFDIDTNPRLYRHIVIDEGQDFSPSMLKSLIKAVDQNDGSITFFGDVAQQIYGSRMSWRSLGFNITSPWKFEENYRNSKQIAKLGLALTSMPYFTDALSDIVEPKSPKADGPLPTLVLCPSDAIEADFVVNQAIEASQTRSVAILYKDRGGDQYLINKRLPKNAILLHRDMDKWTPGKGIYYGTYFAAKGLEFDMVLLPFCDAGRLPDSDYVLGSEEAKIHFGKLLYVGIMRAKTALVITYSGKITELLPTDHRLYEKVKYGDI